jgi:hypothetical protein
MGRIIMRPGYFIQTFTTLVLYAAQVQAGRIDFDNNPINFTAPQVTGGTITVNGPTPPGGTALPNGFSIDNLSYNVTPTGSTPGLVTIVWDASRQFTLTQNDDVTAHIFGNTDTVRVNDIGGTLNFLVEGFLDGSSPVFFLKEGIPTNGPLMWDQSSGGIPTNAGVHTLAETSVVNWRPVSLAATLAISSSYGAAAQVTEPSISFTFGIVFFALICYRSRQRSKRQMDLAISA